ncbi:polysaccharide pyruvyl transferase family protein [Trichococcus pasteurii]|uniref:Polysaccharide pyruvyl transferase n=1 Tax=Trichococcus pasteurii TaxID=43064 RepID=A0A1W1IIA7_9LACT|nr:polysaccharide pyruvyl transferase family protein [Trichococcus pasteurii]SFF09044.1 Polysaccharide pyruvyl transferase [Trichococcus pasteurii]SLM52740.1 polysaccharide pyruvyl transferase [Trichococcus pasteurii]SSB93621.1 polysaccharide pyruvyl transferase [Trichococcus pasteurii]
MKKIGLVTIVDYTNYGNRLQNYAAQQVLESIGFDVTTIINKPDERKDEQTKRNLFEKIKGSSLTELNKKMIHRINRKRNQKALEKKSESFKVFTKKNIKESDFTITDNSVPEDLNKNFDYFVVGSDQVWNPIFRKGSTIDFLTFAPKNKRIAYAPSFGISEIPESYREKYRKWILEFEHLSVREDAGAKIIEDMTNRKALVIVDPTLMLKKEEWLAASKVSKLKPEKPFLLTYFLGELSKEIKDLINSISIDNDLEIVKLGSYEEIKRYATDPGEFIDYINSSSIFLTDSFHGVVFSVLLEKPFVVFNRIGEEPSMNSRIDTLLSKFKLDNRKWENVKQTRKYFNVDFTHTEPILIDERNKAYKYLKNALEITEV